MITSRKKYSGLNLHHKQNNKDWLNGKLKKLKEERKNNINKIKIKMENRMSSLVNKRPILKDLNLIVTKNKLMHATF